MARQPLAGWLEALERLARTRAKAGLTRQLRPRAAGDAVVDLAGNDYLGLAAHPEVIAASAQALSAYGLGATGSRLVRGSTDAHAALEADLAGWLGAEQALVFSSGYLANLGAVRALAGRGHADRLGRVQPRLADRRLQDLRRRDRGRAARRPGRGGRAAGRRARPSRGGGHRVGVLGGR